MDLIATQSCNVVIYLENLYQGNLEPNSLQSINAIPWTNWLQIWMESLSPETNLSQDCEVSLRLTSDRDVQALNCQYRSIDKPTDVLAFAATEADIIIPEEIAEPLYLGDIIISLDTANRQAISQNHSLVMELAWLSSHGLLHLLGWDHPDEVSLKQMLERQSQLIQLLEI
ncbi:rRNA maturation RNase YbeY [Waterburya agarophytonicola K14]|uniref:Endoribonuclease YbeY n=1 Tax=Waterburya agarophytonicola KI4 TaxID=2874699 RepID=A0A964BUG6_9CYAN|nr:rRNA maturation RNase YbeY [Waterburya agarophytonicola]MCC0179031.1 rRNA maturation RNase YbeY [Waterburya agarophytonicola KI4]